MQMIHTSACHLQGLTGLSVDPILMLLTVTVFNVCHLTTKSPLMRVDHNMVSAFYVMF